MPMISRGCPVSHLSPWRPARLPSFSCLSSFSHALWPDEVAEGSSQRSRTGGADRGKQLLRTGGGATAIALYGAGSGAALATVVGVLVEVPVMLSVCAFCNRTRHWFPERSLI